MRDDFLWGGAVAEMCIRDRSKCIRSDCCRGKGGQCIVKYTGNPGKFCFDIVTGLYIYQCAFH